MWALTCHGGCENFLRSDPLWSGTAHTIPETPDETARRTDVEKRGQIEQQTSMAQALNDLAKLGSLPSVLAQLVGHLNLGADKVEAVTLEQELQICRNGHASQRHAKFCGECGADMLDAVNKQPVAALSAPETPSTSEGGESGPDLDAMTFKDLKDLAQELGVEVARSKAEQVALIRAKTS